MQMRTKFLRFGALLLGLILCLSGCTKQRNTDIPEFCKRVNNVQSTEVLNPTEFFCENTNDLHEYHCHMQIFENLTALLTLRTDEVGTVTGFQLTCIPESDNTYPEDAFSALYNTYISLCAVLTVTDVHTAEETVQTAGILQDALHFTAHGFSAETEKHRYAVFSDAAYLSLFCERV